jgi:hypothetical protein
MTLPNRFLNRGRLVNMKTLPRLAKRAVIIVLIADVAAIVSIWWAR